MEQRERKREQNEIARILNYYRISMPEGIDLLAADWHESILRQSGLIPAENHAGGGMVEGSISPNGALRRG